MKKKTRNVDTIEELTAELERAQKDCDLTREILMSLEATVAPWRKVVGHHEMRIGNLECRLHIAQRELALAKKRK